MDTRLFDWVNALARHTGWAHGVIRSYAELGVVLFAVLLVVAAVRGRGSRESLAAVTWAGGAALIALGLAQIIGGLVDRARPYDAIHGVLVLVDRTTDFSFPSDHATTVGAVAAGLWCADRRLGRIAIPLALAMAFARVYVGAHYPGDVMAGLALGAAVATGLRKPGLAVAGFVVGTLLRTPLRRLTTIGSSGSPA